MKTRAFLFPGQGSQHVGMGQAIYERDAVAREIFDQADEILGFPLSDLVFNGPSEALTDTINAQPAILTTSVAIWSSVNQLPNMQPAFFAGHSLGEFSALVCAGSLTFPDGLRLVRDRGRIMKEAGERQAGGMAAILGMDSNVVAEICQQVTSKTGLAVQIANDNCPGQVVISGSSDALDLAMEIARARKARKVVLLDVSIAAHSPLMESGVEEFAERVLETKFVEPVVPLIGNTSARPVVDVENIRKELIAQLTKSVRWTESVRYLLDRNVSDFVEIGPGAVLTGLIKRIDRKAGRFSIEGPDDISTLIERENDF